MEVPLLGIIKEGKATTLFPASGFTQPTWIHLEDDDGNILTIEVKPLMGKIEFHKDRVGANVKVYQ